MSISARELHNHFSGRGGVRRKRTLPDWMGMGMSKQKAKDGSVIQELTDALEVALDLLKSEDLDGGVTGERVRAAIAIGKAAL